MKQVIASERIPAKLWLDDIEEGALKQATNLAKLPFAFHHIAIMPDAHQGYGMPIGGVMATKDVVVPNAVGVDIGCGMCAVKSSIDYYTADSLKKVMGLIRESVPLGFAHHKGKQEWGGFAKYPEVQIVERELQAAQYQLGTLGGSNHFMEIQRDQTGFLWLMLHSGSRNFGLKIAKEYHDRARELCNKWYSQIPDQELAFLPLDIPEADEYIAAMNYALAFALESRKRMMGVMKNAMEAAFCNIAWDEPINVHHNYARMENHFGSNVMVHRKGATSAKLDEAGIIPGSQGTASYIVKGLGNADSFQSCSHGAGRRMGRKQAIRELSLVDEKKLLDDAGIIHSIRSEKDLDEAAGAYKNIDAVMDNQKDLVDIVVKLKPLAVIKG